MKKPAIILLIMALLLVSCDKEQNKVVEKFDAYEWSWLCWDVENKFTLWKEHMTVKNMGEYWLIEGESSDRDDMTKRISSDETGKILIVYDLENDKITDRVHGEWEVEGSVPEIDDQGKFTNILRPIYC